MTDEEWLLQRKRRATEAQVESFCERVSIIMADYQSGDFALKLARSLALEAINHDYG